MFPYTRGDPLPDWRVLQEGPESIALRRSPAPGDALIIGGGGGRDMLHRAVVERPQRRRHRAQPRDPRHRRQGPARRSRARPTRCRGCRPRSATAARRSPHRDKRLRDDPDRLHGHLQPELGAGVRADREQPLHGRGGRGVPRPPEARRRADARAAGRALRRGGAARDRARARRAAAARRRRPERNVVVVLGNYDAPFRRFVYGTVLAKNEPFTAAEIAALRQLVARARARASPTCPAGRTRREWAELAAAPDDAGVLRGLRARRLPADRRQAVLLQHEAAVGHRRRHHRGDDRRARPDRRAADRARRSC